MNLWIDGNCGDSACYLFSSISTLCRNCSKSTPIRIVVENSWDEKAQEIKETGNEEG
jgi:hypothetical protein